MSVRWGGRGPGHLSRWPKATSSGPTPAEQIAALFDGHDGIYLRGGDSSAYFLTDVGQVNVSANDDTIGLALDAHLMAGVAAGAFIDALAKTAVTGWTNNGWDVFSSTGDSFSAEKTETGGVDSIYSNAYLPVVTNNDFFVLEVDVEANTLTGGGAFSLSNATAARSTLADIATGQTGTVRGIVNYTAGSGSPFSIRVRTLLPGVLEVSSARGARLNGNHLTQSTASFRPKWQSATGARRYDAFDDCLPSAKNAGASGNSIVMQLTAPASVASTQVLGGMQADTSTRFFLAINTSGQLCAGVGTDGTATIVGTTDIRGLTGTAALVEDGSTVRLYWNGVEEYSDVQDGSPTTTIPFIEGALNNNGTPQTFCGADILDTIFIDTALTPSEIADRTDNWS